MTNDQYTFQDPTTQYPKPEYGDQSQPHPGTDEPMSPDPDHGEKTYRGGGRLEGRRA